MKTAIVYGANGQTGSYLCEFLLFQGYKIIGCIRRNSANNLQNLKECIKNPNFSIEKVDITDAFSVFSTNNKYKINELYNLAANSHVGASFDMPAQSIDVSISGSLNCLEWLRQNKDCRYYFAATSELWGSSFDVDHNTNKKFQDEDTIMKPNSPYGVGKLAGFNLTRMYRNSYGLHANSGILTNHESPRRSDDFVTKKIINYVKAKDFRVPLKLGRVDVYRDWGHAKDFCKAMYLILQQESPDDYVISTGESRSVEQFIRDVSKIAFSNSGFQIPYTCGNKEFERPFDVPYLRGDSSKARKILGWKPLISYEELIQDMLEN